MKCRYCNSLPPWHDSSCYLTSNKKETAGLLASCIVLQPGMKIPTKSNTEVDVTPWLPQMRENLRLNRNIFDMTPLGTTSKGGYFWWDEHTNPSLDTRAVENLINQLVREKMKEKKQCQFAEFSVTIPRCTEKATCKYGDYWFCAEHGKRDKPKKKESYLEKVWGDD